MLLQAHTAAWWKHYALLAVGYALIFSIFNFSNFAFGVIMMVGTFGAVDRDPGERVISVAYYALININEYDRKLVKKHNAYWVNINELPALIFDHPEMVTKARELMKQKASSEPIGFNLLPKLFTLSQLQSLYEAIYGEEMDKRNFRKRVAGMDYIEKTDKIDKLGSKRGAALYKFNSKVYRKDPKFKL